jgi:hypothetical protein
LNPWIRQYFERTLRQQYRQEKVQLPLSYAETSMSGRFSTFDIVS